MSDFAVQKANKATLDAALGTKTPVLVWVGCEGDTPPTDVKKALDSASKEYTDRLNVFIADTTDSPELREQFKANKRAVLVGLYEGEAVTRRQRPWAADIEAIAKQMVALVPPPVSQNAVLDNDTNKEIVDMAPVIVTDSTFEEEVLNSDLPVLVDFWAEWCGPCRMVAPILDKLSEEFAGQIRIAKVDVDHNQGLAQAFRIMSIPTMMFIKEGKIVGQQAGALPEPVLRDAINQLIALEIPTE